MANGDAEWPAAKKRRQLEMRVRFTCLQQDPTLYVTHRDAREPAHRMCVILRISGDAAALAPAVRRAMSEWSASIAVTEMITMEGLDRRMLAAERYCTTRVGAFAGIALLLAAVGVFGVTAQAVRRQWREFGVRLRPGGSPHGVLLGVLGRTGAAAAIGSGAGGLAAIGLEPLLSLFLDGVSAADPLSYGAAAVLLFAAAIVAGWLPARRGARLDRASVLRSE